MTLFMVKEYPDFSGRSPRMYNVCLYELHGRKSMKPKLLAPIRCEQVLFLVEKSSIYLFRMDAEKCSFFCSIPRTENLAVNGY